MRRLSHLGRVGGQLLSYSAVHREWWLLGVIVLLALVALLLSATHAAAPYALYTLF